MLTAMYGTTREEHGTTSDNVGEGIFSVSFVLEVQIQFKVKHIVRTETKSKSEYVQHSCIPLYRPAAQAPRRVRRRVLYRCYLCPDDGSIIITAISVFRIHSSKV